ncbi:Uma2 family endonuclease [Amycolatopsis sp. NPDC003861]
MEWPRDLLTLDDWCGLPEISEYHVEVVEGVLLVAPRPRLLHQGATARLAYRVDEWLPHGFTALSGVEMVVSAAPLTVRVPDVLVAPSSLVETNPARLDAGDVRLVVEVLSEGTRRTDRLIEGTTRTSASSPASPRSNSPVARSPSTWTPSPPAAPSGLDVDDGGTGAGRRRRRRETARSSRRRSLFARNRTQDSSPR